MSSKDKMQDAGRDPSYWAEKFPGFDNYVHKIMAEVHKGQSAQDAVQAVDPEGRIKQNISDIIQHLDSKARLHDGDGKVEEVEGEGEEEEGGVISDSPTDNAEGEGVKTSGRKHGSYRDALLSEVR